MKLGDPSVIDKELVIALPNTCAKPWAMMIMYRNARITNFAMEHTRCSNYITSWALFAIDIIFVFLLVPVFSWSSQLVSVMTTWIISLFYAILIGSIECTNVICVDSTFSNFNRRSWLGMTWFLNSSRTWGSVDTILSFNFFKMTRMLGWCTSLFLFSNGLGIITSS